jgi:quercetin dioxygenase-like cupin family protein
MERVIRRRLLLTSAALAVIAGNCSVALSDAPPAHASVQTLMHKDLEGDPTREVIMLTVEFPPGVQSPAHRHDAQVFVYVLQGELRNQINDAPVATLPAGSSFYEGINDVHRVSANPSTDQAAKILVVMIKKKDQPASRPAS